MSRYTTELRYICETLAGLDESVGYNDVAKVIEAARPKLFDFNYPIYDSAYKAVLETKIIKHYYTREIGSETYGLFKLRLDATLNEIMPYYNKLYESALLEYNPLYSADYYESHEGSGDTSETGSRSGTDTRTLNTQLKKTGTVRVEDDRLEWNKFSDTPQGGITGLDSDRYLTNATKDTADNETLTTHNTTDSNTGTDALSRSESDSKAITSSDEYINHIYGKMAGESYSKMIQEYRDTLLNIDLLIIDELKDLFMLLY